MENETRRNMLETYAKALEGGLMPLDAAKVLVGRMEADKAFRDAVLLMAGFDFLPRLKAGDSCSVWLNEAVRFGGFPLHGR